jgi:hypothetical protein
MGYMKKLLAFVVFLFAFASVASAHEGSVDLTNSQISCKGISIFQDGNYKVSGRCDGLVYPYETTYSRYVLWGKTTSRGETIRISEVDRGYFSGYIASPFDSMFITAEKDGLVRKPSDKQVVLGKVSAFSFDKSQVTTPAASSAPATTTTGTTVQNSTATTSSTAGAVIGKIVTSLLVIILVIVGLAIGASLIFRKRGSVSA